MSPKGTVRNRPDPAPEAPEKLPGRKRDPLRHGVPLRVALRHSWSASGHQPADWRRSK